MFFTDTNIIRHHPSDFCVRLPLGQCIRYPGLVIDEPGLREFPLKQRNDIQPGEDADHIVFRRGVDPNAATHDGLIKIDGQTAAISQLNVVITESAALLHGRAFKLVTPNFRNRDFVAGRQGGPQYVIRDGVEHAHANGIDPAFTAPVAALMLATVHDNDFGSRRSHPFT